MASFAECIDIAFEQGKITKQVADTIKQAEDPETAINGLVGNLTRTKREAAIQSVRLSDAWEKAQSHEGGAYAGLIALMTKDPTGRANYMNVEYLGKYYEGKYHAQFAEALSRFRTRTIGLTQDA